MRAAGAAGRGGVQRARGGRAIALRLRAAACRLAARLPRHNVRVRTRAPRARSARHAARRVQQRPQRVCRGQQAQREARALAGRAGRAPERSGPSGRRASQQLRRFAAADLAPDTGRLTATCGEAAELCAGLAIGARSECASNTCSATEAAPAGCAAWRAWLTCAAKPRTFPVCTAG